jgi:hypothetical protein
MPNLTVPRSPDDPIRQRPIQTPTVRNAFSAENFGGGPARAAAFREAQGISQDGEEIVKEAKKRQFILRMDEEKRAIDEWELSTLHDQEKGAVAKKGRDVFGLDKQVTDQFEQFVKDRRAGLSTEAERDAFDLAITTRRSHVQGWLKDHIGRQMKVYEAQEFEAGAENAKRMGALSEQEAAKQLPYLRRLLLTQSKAQGWGPEITSKVLRDQESDLHTRVIRRKIDAEDYAGAQTYLDANRGRMLDEEAEHIASLLKRGSILGEAQRIRDLAFLPMSQAYVVREGEDAIREIPAPKNLKEAIERGRKMTEGKEPELQKAVDHQITAEWELRQRAEKEAYLELVEQATEMVMKTGSTDSLPEGLRRQDIMGLQSLAQRLRTKTEPVTDWAKYTALKDMASDPASRRDFLDMPPLSYRDYLSDERFKEITDLRAGLLKGDEKAKKRADGYRTMAGIIGSTLDAAGFSKQENLAERNVIEQIMDEEVKHYRAMNKNEDPDNEFVQKKITQLVTKAKVNDKWLDQYGYMTTQRYLDKADTEIPAEERKAIEDEMRRQGLTPTRRAIIEAYEAKQTRKPFERWLPK